MKNINYNKAEKLSVLLLPVNKAIVCWSALRNPCFSAFFFFSIKQRSANAKVINVIPVLKSAHKALGNSLRWAEGNTKQLIKNRDDR